MSSNVFPVGHGVCSIPTVRIGDFKTDGFFSQIILETSAPTPYGAHEVSATINLPVFETLSKISSLFGCEVEVMSITSALSP